MPNRYPRLMVILHWLLAILIILLLAVGKFVLDGMPNSDPARITTLTGHMVFAGVILILMLARLAIRARSEVPPAANALAPLVHMGLYVLVFLMLGSGIAMSVGFGLPQVVFMGQGALPEAFGGLARSIHGWTSTALVALIALHIAAVIYHAAVRRDGVMARMGLRR